MAGVLDYVALYSESFKCGMLARLEQGGTRRLLRCEKFVKFAFKGFDSGSINYLVWQGVPHRSGAVEEEVMSGLTG